MQQFQQSSTTTKVVIIGLLVAIVAVLICACVGLGRYFLFPPADVAGPATTPTSIPVTTATPIPAQPTVEPTPAEFEGWRGEYFNNTNLLGEPVLVRDDERINFDWGTNSPAPEVPADNFSVRWTISREVPAGIYRFTGTFDNGVRLWIDDSLISDKWVAAPVRTGSVDVNLATGSHTVRLEYFHGGGPAVAQLWVEYLENFPDWKAEYFAQPDFNSPPAVVRNELEINYNWGTTSPIPGTIPDNNYAVRWSRGADFDTGNYLFMAEVEGGVRVYLNNRILIDSWGESALRHVEGTASLSRGQHDLKVEYWKQSGNGQIHFGWAKLQEPEQPPLAVINGPSNAVVGQTVSFNGRSSSVAEGSQLVSYDWDFGDGIKASGVDVSHVYNSPGSFAVTLTVVDDKGLTDSTVHQIQIDDRQATPQPEQPPIPVIDAPSQARVGDLVTFDSSRSISANPIVRNVWEFGDGARVDNAVKAQHAYGQAGVYRVKLTVEDNQGLKSEAYHQIEIANVQPEPTPEPDQPPIAQINAPASVKVGESFIVDAADSDCATTCVSYAWDMGDGTQVNAVTFQHIYQSPGDFNIVLAVTDDKGLQSTANQLINVTVAPPPEQPQPPKAVINGPVLAAVGQPVSFSSSSQPGSGGPIVEYVWDFGDGNRDNSGPAVTHIYVSPGTFTVRLAVADREGQSDTAEWPIQISAAMEPPTQPPDGLQPGQLPVPLPGQPVEPPTQPPAGLQPGQLPAPLPGQPVEPPPQPGQLPAPEPTPEQ